MFIQCNGPESRTNASISINRIREDDDNTTEAQYSGSTSTLANNGSSSGSGGSGHSFFNRSEAVAVVQCVQQLLLSGGLSSANVGVITPYSGQVSVGAYQTAYFFPWGGMVTCGYFHPLALYACYVCGGLKKLLSVRKASCHAPLISHPALGFIGIFQHRLLANKSSIFLY